MAAVGLLPHVVNQSDQTTPTALMKEIRWIFEGSYLSMFILSCPKTLNVAHWLLRETSTWAVMTFKNTEPSLLNHIRWLDGDAALLLVFTRVCETGLSGTGRSNDPRLGHQGVCQRGLSMVHVGNHRHVPDVGLLVHDGTDLIHCEVHLMGREGGLISSAYNQQNLIVFIRCVYLFKATVQPFQVELKKETCLKLNPPAWPGGVWAPHKDFTSWFLTNKIRN